MLLDSLWRLLKSFPLEVRAKGLWRCYLAPGYFLHRSYRLLQERGGLRRCPCSAVLRDGVLAYVLSRKTKPAPFSYVLIDLKDERCSMCRLWFR